MAGVINLADKYSSAVLERFFQDSYTQGSFSKKFDGEYPDRFEKEIFQYLSLDRQHFPWASQLFEQPRMDREYFMHLADRFRSPHLWKWEDNMWKLRYTPYEGDSEVLWGDPRGTHHEV